MRLCYSPMCSMTQSSLRSVCRRDTGADGAALATALHLMPQGPYPAWVHKMWCLCAPLADDPRSTAVAASQLTMPCSGRHIRHSFAGRACSRPKAQRWCGWSVLRAGHGRRPQPSDANRILQHGSPVMASSGHQLTTAPVRQLSINSVTGR